MIFGQISLAITFLFGCHFLQKALAKNRKKAYEPTYALLGDVGGTNIRLQLVLIKPPLNEPIQMVKKQKLKVNTYDNFQESIRSFLNQVPHQKLPKIAAIGIAGPVNNNKVQLANVPKWGQLNGGKLGLNLKIPNFNLINDFTATSLGLLIMQQDNFISLNGFQIDKEQTLGVLGPGTGLGNSVIFIDNSGNTQKPFLLPGQGGHIDFTYTDEQTLQYFHFFKKKANISYIGHERSFCGPSIPYMFQFFVNKFPEFQKPDITPSSQQIIQRYLKDSQKENAYKKAIELFLKLYSNAIANFMAIHMCKGGLFLVGSLTNELVEIMKKRDLLEGYGERHPQMYKIIKNFPIVVSKQIDLGLRGAYVFARKKIVDEQDE